MLRLILVVIRWTERVESVRVHRLNLKCIVLVQVSQLLRNSLANLG